MADMVKRFCNTFLTEGIFLLVIGALLMLLPMVTTFAMSVLISVALLVAGVYKFINTVIRRDEIEKPWLNILISMLVGTLHIAAYGSYSMLTNSFSAVMTQLNSATSGSVGNLMAEGDKRHMDEVLRRLTFVTYCPAVLCANGVCCASTAFVSILFGKEYILPQPVVAVLSFNFFISLIKNPLWQMMQVSGLFARDKNISIAGSTINLILSVVLGSRYGIIGILLGTTSTYLVQIILKIKLLYRDFFFFFGGKYSFLIARLSLAYLSSAVLSHFLGRWFTVTLNIYQEFLIRGVISVVVAGSLTVLLFGHSEEMKYAVQLWKNIRKKFKGSKKGEQECQG